ncbi:hypothetical protein NHX12_030394 [Muraenolepis orangiensis]|uniref:Uncharacterized protein n=1 Tax=Muraenolepis orangiensis TaxID=630683 RepID=A0A9Q0EC01_9TELE|nr:hypothetical protein NHX12_030394 [Muraenolepis orangiensis]
MCSSSGLRPGRALVWLCETREIELIGNCKNALRCLQQPLLLVKWGGCYSSEVGCCRRPQRANSSTVSHTSVTLTSYVTVIPVERERGSTLLYWAVLYSTLLGSSLLYWAGLYSILLGSTLLYWAVIYSTLLYSTLLYWAVLYSILLGSTLLYWTVLYSILLYSTLLGSSLLYSTRQYSTLLDSTLLYSTRQYSTLLY